GSFFLSSDRRSGSFFLFRIGGADLSFLRSGAIFFLQIGEADLLDFK
ncbi:9786_t:CDS:2, partial [Funneliformis caledonium]